jgi:hypothetical protein
MGCEGYYLHKLVAVAFAQQPSLKYLYVVGWGENSFEMTQSRFRISE